MSVEREIAGMLRTLAQKSGSGIFPAIVKSVEGITCTVERTRDGKKLQNVRLSLVENEEEGLVVTPVEESQVLVASVNEHNRFVCQYSEIEKVTLNTTKGIVINGGDKIEINGGDKIEINAVEKIEMSVGDNGGNNDGLVKIRKLENNLDNIKTYLDNLNTAIATGLSSTVSDNGATAASTFTTTMKGSSLVFEDMENDKITH